MEPTVFHPCPRRLERLNGLQMSLQRQHFLLSYLKTLSVGPAGVRTRDLPLSRPAFSQLSQPGGDSITIIILILIIIIIIIIIIILQ